MENSTFCKACGKILKIAKASENTIICGCGFENENKGVSYSQKEPKKEEKGKGVYKEDASKKNTGFPHICQKCGHEWCEVFDLGVQYGDESNVILYKCKKCNFVERQADGCGNV